ncbi:hypothetical protein HaLaN_30157, partial [Haematococcus lacustris]
MYLGQRKKLRRCVTDQPKVLCLCRLCYSLKSLVSVHIRCANLHVRAEGCDHPVNFIYPASLGRDRQLPTPEEEIVEEPLPADPDLEQVPGGSEMDVMAAERKSLGMLMHDQMLGAFDLKCVPGQDGGKWSKRPQGHFRYDPSLPGADRARLAKLMTDLQAKQVAHHASDAHTTAMLELLASTSTVPNIPASASAMRTAMEQLGQPQEEYL